MGVFFVDSSNNISSKIGVLPIIWNWNILWNSSPTINNKQHHPACIPYQKSYNLTPLKNSFKTHSKHTDFNIKHSCSVAIKNHNIQCHFRPATLYICYFFLKTDHKNSHPKSTKGQHQNYKLFVSKERVITPKSKHNQLTFYHQNTGFTDSSNRDFSMGKTHYFPTELPILSSIQQALFHNSKETFVISFPRYHGLITGNRDMSKIP